MSQSPDQIKDSTVLAGSDAYLKAWEQMNALVAAGHSWSGNERNCAFLNTGDGRFSDVSLVSGFDLPIDGRSLALVDWDHDGDLDIWMTNRTGPRLRFMRNDLPAENRHIAFQLEGKTCNRDAIGARVEVHFPGRSKLPLIKTLRAGEGFLGQSSKWLHFGLGSKDTPEKIVIRWPGGRAEEFRDVQANRKYRLVQQSGTAHLWTRPTPPSNRAPSHPVVDAPRRESGILLLDRLPLMSLKYQTFAGKPQTVSVKDSPFTLINLWAAWCPNCQSELKNFSQHRRDLEAAGLNIVALSTDAFDTVPESDREDAKKFLESIKSPFVAGLATEALVEQLEIIHGELFQQPTNLPLPTSFLLDAEGRLAGVYRGPVEAHQLISDTQTLTSGNGHPPFSGRWISPPKSHDPFKMVWTMAENGFVDQAMEYITRHDALLVNHFEYHKLLALVGNGQLGRGQAKQAIALYQKALRVSPNYVEAQNNLAWTLATHPNDKLRNGNEAVRLAEAAIKQMGATPHYLDTLAAAYAEAGRFPDAIAAAKKSTELARSEGLTQNAQSVEKRLRLYEAQMPWREK